MPTPEEMVASMTAAKAELESKAEVKEVTVAPVVEPDAITVVTDKAEIEAALADTVVEPTEMELVLAEIAKIHSQYNSRSDIPVGHQYWVLCNRLNSLRNP